MVDRSSTLLDGTFHALANETRRALVSRLQSGPASISELAAPFDMSFYGVSKHLKVLEEAGLVERRVEGREHRFELRPAPLRHAQGWLLKQAEFWDRSLDRLDGLLATRRAKRGRKDT